MSDFRVYKTIHFKEEWANRITEMHHKQWNTTKGTYMYYDVLNMNYDPKHHFFILGLLDNNVIASCFVSTYEDYKNDEEVKAWVNNIVKAYSTELKPATMTYTYPVYAMSQTIINYSQTLVTTDYQIIKTIQLSRANDSKEIVVAEFTIDEYGDFNAEIKTNIHLNGIGHGHGHGHGNGHGHGDYNAGGSIVDAL